MSDQHERPRIAKEPISVLMPVYNQAAGLDAIVGGWVRELDRLDRPYELFVIDDASTDATATVAERMALARPSMRVLRHDQRQGFGACLRTGLAAAAHPLVVWSRCDYPYQPVDLKNLIGVIDGVDMVLGARTDPVPPWMRRFGRVYRILVRVLLGISREPLVGWRGWAEWRRGLWLRWMFGLRVADVGCAFKLFRRGVFDRLVIQSNGDFVQAEVLAKANFMGCLIAEVPVGRLGGHFRGVPEPEPAGALFSMEVRRVFRNPTFAPMPVAPVASSPDGDATAFGQDSETSPGR